MKHFILSTVLLLAIGSYAEEVHLTLSANNCEAVNTITCPDGQQLRVTAEASLKGSQFECWSDGNTDNPRLITVSQDTALTAIYSRAFTLTLYANDCEMVNTITCPEGQQLRVTAETILDGSKFESWSDGNTENPRVITIGQDTTLTAIYSRVYTLTLYAEGCEAVNTIKCPNGQQLRLTAEAILDDSHFDRWSDGVTTNPRVIVVNSDMALTAIYNSTQTSIGEVDSQTSKVESQKILRDGVLLIERNGVYYNAQGAVVE